MKSKKKVGLVKRIAAGVCLLVILFYVFDDVNFKANVSLDSYLEFCDVPVFLTSDGLYSYNSSYNYVVCYEPSNNRLLLYEFHGSYNFYILNGRPVFEKNGGASYSLFSYSFKGGMWTYGSANLNNSTSLACYIGEELMSEATYFFTSCDIFDNDKLENIVYDGGFSIKNGVTSDVFGGTYNSTLGYLQDLLCKELYLEDAEYAYDPEALKKVWTFSNTSTTGLDITDGTYSIRHYQQITVRDSDVDPIIKEYDMILMNEVPIDSCRYEYMSKDYSTRLETESAFEPLSFWDTTVLGRFVFTRNYFQLVRTNEDGSVEYGGLVKIDLKGSPAANDLNAEHETTTITPEGAVDSDGYVGGNMDYVQGSGSDYGQAENNADKEAANSSTSSGEALDELDNILSTVSAVPEAFTRMFAFLPDWCLNSIGISVVAGFAIIIWKVGRG